MVVVLRPIDGFELIGLAVTEFQQGWFRRLQRQVE